VANGNAHVAVVVGTFGSCTQQLDGVFGDGADNTFHGAELLHQFCCGGRVVGAIVEARRKVGHCLGDAKVPTGACGFGQCLIGGIAHRVAAELPTPAAHFQQTEIVEFAHLGGIELLTELFGKGLQRGDGARRAECRRVLDDLALARRQLIEAGDDQCPQ